MGRSGEREKRGRGKGYGSPGCQRYGDDENLGAR